MSQKFFGSRDLALVLSDDVDARYASSSQSSNRQAEEEAQAQARALKPKVDSTKKITRYFPNQVSILV